jgi:hypothetical protein
MAIIEKQKLKISQTGFDLGITTKRLRMNRSRITVKVLLNALKKPADYFAVYRTRGREPCG